MPYVPNLPRSEEKPAVVSTIGGLFDASAGPAARLGLFDQKLNATDRFTVRTPSTLVGCRKKGDVIRPL